MRQALFALAAAAALGSCGGEGAPAKPDRTLAEADRTRFLYLAVLEGVWEDGADRPLCEGLIKDDPLKLFVAKCPICMPVLDALRAYVKELPAMMYDGRGTGFPDDLAIGIKSADRKALSRPVVPFVRSAGGPIGG